MSEQLKHVATCETNGHIFGAAGNCIFCGIEKVTTALPQQAMSEWQPIETAPKDGKRILLWAAGDHVIGGWCVSAAPYAFEGWSTGWETSDGYDVGFSSIYPPTHWMPLSEPPK